jgi:predicted transcriptional regulator
MSGALTRLAQTLRAHHAVLGALCEEPQSLNGIARALDRTNGPVGRHLGALEMLGVAERVEGGWRLCPGVVDTPTLVDLPGQAAARCACAHPLIDGEGDCARCGRAAP